MNYRINKIRKRYSTNKKPAKEIFLPSLRTKISSNNPPKQDENIQSSLQNPKNNLNKLDSINNSNKKPDKKNNRPSIFLNNHKPYSGNPSNKKNNNIVNLKVPKRNNIPNSYERDILTANPSIIGDKSIFKNYNENNPNLRYIDKNFIKEENIKENIELKNHHNKVKNRKLYRKMGFGTSKSSPRISSIKVIPNPFENQKQKEMNDLSNKVKVLFSYGDINNLNKNISNNIFKIKRISKTNSDVKSFNYYSNSLIKDKNFNYNLPSLLGPTLIQSPEAKNLLIKAVDKLNSELIKKHPNLKSANLNNQLSESYIKNKLGPKLSKNISKRSLNNSLKYSINNNSLIKLNEDKNQLKPKSKCFISYAYIDYPNLEHRQEMEDFHCIKQALGKRSNLSYFAIFDGHGGKEVASFLSVNLHHFLIDEINNIKFGINDEENINNIIECIKIAFLKIDQKILSNEKLVNDVGSTATLIFIYYNNLNENFFDNHEIKDVERTLICANIGDSSGYLITKSKISQITKAHKCEDPSEVQRIRDKGGIVFQGRIFGKLILTRTLGDKEMKKYGVISAPDFFTKKIEQDDLFVIIGSDGIWDVINEEEIFKMGNEKELSSETFSKKIMDIAKIRDTRDNSSCIVIKLNKNI